MKVSINIGGDSVDACDLGALTEAFTPIVRRRVAESGMKCPSYAEQAVELRQALTDVSTLVCAVHIKLGALVFQRDKFGVIDTALAAVVDELADALGFNQGSEDDSPQLVVPE